MEEKLRQQPTNLIKVVLFGPESSGKTTLAKALAEHYNTLWVPEYSRAYLQKKWDREHKICEPKDILPIGQGQMQTENTLSQQATKILFCDTDLLETKVYSEAYFDGFCDPLLATYALKNKYDLYLLTDIDIPWEQDDLRDRPTRRKEMFGYFEKALNDYTRNYVTINGELQERLSKATKYIDQLLKA